MAEPLANVVRLTPVPRMGDLFIDVRGDGRTMRVSLHPDRDIAVISLWSGSTCRASFRLPLEDSARLAELLAPAGTRPRDAERTEADHPYPDVPYPGLVDAGLVDPGD